MYAVHLDIHLHSKKENTLLNFGYTLAYEYETSLHTFAYTFTHEYVNTLTQITQLYTLSVAYLLMNI